MSMSISIRIIKRLDSARQVYYTAERWYGWAFLGLWLKVRDDQRQPLRKDTEAGMRESLERLF